MSTVLQQRSFEWRQLRLGDVTASRFKDVLTQPRTKAARWSETARSYLIEKLSELITCQPSDMFKTDATQWGIEWEAEAFQEAAPAIEKHFGAALDHPVDEHAYCHHPTEDRIGCSPDGVIGDDGLLEIKCPFNPVNHMRTVMSGEMPKQHTPQVQGSLWVTGRQFYAFCSYDPRVKSSGLDPLFIMLVKRDDEYIDGTLAPRVTAFRDWLVEEYRRLTDGKKPF